VVGEGAAPTVAPASQSFESALGDSLASIRSLQEDVQQKTRGLVLGEDVELHEVMLAANKSEVAMNLLLEVRNKLVDAWEKLSRSAV
jgi:flagellar hook-basal body complex protein FliE